MHSLLRVSFDLPQRASWFDTLVGIDRQMGSQASTDCMVYADKIAGKPLFRSGTLRGGEQPAAVGPLRVTGCRSLVLLAQWRARRCRGCIRWISAGTSIGSCRLSPWMPTRASIAGRFSVSCPAGRSGNWTRPRPAACELTPSFERGTGGSGCRTSSLTGSTLVLRRRLSPVAADNEHVEACFRSTDRVAAANESRLRMDGAAVAPAIAEHEERTPARPVPPPPGWSGRRGGGRGPRLEVGGQRSGAAAGGGGVSETVTHRVQAMQWNLHKFRGRTVELALSLTCDQRQRVGLARAGSGGAVGQGGMP